MADAGDRFSRQIRLAEVSVEGQEKLGRSVVEVRGRDSVDVERLYLERAGVGLVTHDEDAEPAPFRHAGAFHYAAPRGVAKGAARALLGLVRTLGLG